MASGRDPGEPPVDGGVVPTGDEGAVEEVDGALVLDVEALTGPTEHAAVGVRRAGAIAAARGAAVVAGTGFVAGAAAVALLTHRVGGRRRPPRRGTVVGTRSFLVDVHVLADR